MLSLLPSTAALASNPFKVFSPCVADPSSERTIARKEVLQEALGQLSADGTRTQYTASERAHLQAVVAQYAQAAMPFSPPEYPRSSRKRLVEDLGARLAASVDAD